MSGTRANHPPTQLFTQVNVDCASHVIVDQIKQLITDRSLKPGGRLPNEREFCQQLDISRVTVREALRVLGFSSSATPEDIAALHDLVVAAKAEGSGPS